MSDFSRNAAKRWCFTINNPDENDKLMLLGTDSDGRQADFRDVQYLIMQEERGENGTLHWQGFVIFKKPKRLTWLKRNFNERAHFEVARGTNEEARDYCKKDDTYTGGMRYEYGEMPPKRKAKKREERLEDAAEVLDLIKQNPTKLVEEIDSFTLLQPGFIQAYRLLTADKTLDKMRELTIVTMVGPPGTGKSYQAFHRFPTACRVTFGNCGAWFSNPTADTLVIEEFHGQIQLGKMLTILDGYPMQLEVKGHMYPALYTKVIITTNLPPELWYSYDEGDKKRESTIQALFDRLGYAYNGYQPVRRCGHYIEVGKLSDCIGLSVDEYIKQCREIFSTELDKIFGPMPQDGDDQ